MRVATSNAHTRACNPNLRQSGRDRACFRSLGRTNHQMCSSSASEVFDTSILGECKHECQSVCTLSVQNSLDLTHLGWQYLVTLPGKRGPVIIGEMSALSCTSTRAVMLSYKEMTKPSHHQHLKVLFLQSQEAAVHHCSSRLYSPSCLSL